MRDQNEENSEPAGDRVELGQVLVDYPDYDRCDDLRDQMDQQSLLQSYFYESFVVTGGEGGLRTVLLSSSFSDSLSMLFSFYYQFQTDELTGKNMLQIGQDYDNLYQLIEEDEDEDEEEEDDDDDDDDEEKAVVVVFGIESYKDQLKLIFQFNYVKKGDVLYCKEEYGVLNGNYQSGTYKEGEQSPELKLKGESDKLYQNYKYYFSGSIQRLDNDSIDPV
ncbi:MAG: hypothetical protein EZS28_012761 [Streblomastix strix]|uniref:Uncharacterized protein n=1 Tax=Streblomastix strix TaxID=222440 RepID=A0A5J4WB14_9EUKA|nr:MAG: hypothetical protein EZS28_012761 [Streblomastix strix]